jgi:hypothetical protein
MMLPYATGLGKAYRATKIHAPCFVAGTPVETESGLKPIEKVEVGDLILSRDEKTGERSFKKAVATYETPDQRIIEIQFESEDGGTETIGATAEHPFWVKARGWVGAGDLLPGDEVFTSQGGWIKVSGSTWLSKRQTVYNLEVEDYHTYFVGESGAWVHNMCMMPKSRPNQWHHFASNKNKIYTPRFRKIANRYGLDLDDSWNIDLLPHQGRHPNDYHDFVERGMERAAREAGDNKEKFLNLFNKYTKETTRKNPDILRKSGWNKQ